MSDFTKAYRADKIDSLQTLELSCENDEFGFEARITKLELAKVGDVKVAAATYTNDDVDENTNLGELILVKYTGDVDRLTQKAIQRAKNNQFLFEGKAYVNNSPVKLLVFREHK
jgi:hypothetical protein